MEQSADTRVKQLENLVASLRHDIRGLLAPALLIADHLSLERDPTIQLSGARITNVIGRIVSTLDATYDAVPQVDYPTTGPEVSERGYND